MTGVEAMKAAVESWFMYTKHFAFKIDKETIWEGKPEWVNKLCDVIYKLTREVFNFKKGTWEYEGF